MTTFAMIDLETLDTLPSAQILTVGGVKFDPFNDKPLHSEFYYKIDIDQQDAVGRTVSEHTLDWWGKQSPEIINESFSTDRTDCITVMKELKKWCVGVDRFWSQGSFDMTILESFYRDFDQPIPWAFWTLCDSRTIFDRMPKDPRKEISFAAHNALEDAKAQALALRIAFKHFGMKK